MKHITLLSILTFAILALFVGCYTELAEAPAITSLHMSEGCRVVSISTSVEKADIHYTTDGSDPTADSPKFFILFTIDQDTTVKAVAVKGKRIVSEVATAHIVMKAQTPTISVAGGSYLLAQSVELSTEEGAVIHYTTDGSTPDSSSPTYTSAITVDSNMTIKAVAVKEGYDNSPDVQATYEIGYKPGTLGPAGGYVFYDCDADNDETNGGAGPDGLKSSECGWRYLEAAPADVSGGTTHEYEFVFGYYRTTPTGENMYANGSTTYVAGTSSATDGNATGTAIGTGKANTAKLVAKMGDSAYIDSSGTKTAADYAAKVCDEYTYGGCDDWFLPSKDELNLMHTNLYEKGLGGFSAENYWSSSEDGTNIGYTLLKYFCDDLLDLGRRCRYYYARVRAVRAF